MTTSTEGHRISAVAARTGFSASAIRYYEDAGLLEPARTPAGYRVYDDRSIERLRFIARGKDLGLTLDEIAELLPAWEGDDCVEVAGQLASQVAEKLAATRVRIAELIDFAADLERAGRRLATEVVDGPCGDSCACAPPVPDSRTVVTLGRAGGDGAAPPPIACTLDATAMGVRFEEWRRLVDEATAQEPIDGGVRLRFPVGTAPGPIAELAAIEQRCGSFVTFRITLIGDSILLDVMAPPDGRSMVDELVGASR